MKIDKSNVITLSFSVFIIFMIYLKYIGELITNIDYLASSY